MPNSGTYLLASVGFSRNEKPLLLLQEDDTFTDLHPLGRTLTVSFDTRQRYCTGWRDISTGERFVCPDHHLIDTKYEQCSSCQKRTGFNPAFYHATSVSSQQEARNQEPHILYLAHFGKDVIKVGISHAKRGRSRLLEQGARSAIILEELSSAHIARHYEERIARLHGFSETIQQRKKIDLLSNTYDAKSAKSELLQAKEVIESSLGMAFDKPKILLFDTVYFPDETIDISSAHNLAAQHLISGECIGQLGTMLFCRQDDAILYLPLKKYVGYTVTVSDIVTSIDTPARQISLF